MENWVLSYSDQRKNLLELLAQKKLLEENYLFVMNDVLVLISACINITPGTAVEQSTGESWSGVNCNLYSLISLAKDAHNTDNFHHSFSAFSFVACTRSNKALFPQQNLPSPINLLIRSARWDTFSPSALENSLTCQCDAPKNLQILKI